MANQETILQNEIRLGATSPSTRLFRNNVGMIDGVNFGLAIGSSDLIGFKTIEITPHMIGKSIAQFVSLEVKTPRGKVSVNQQKWLDMVAKFGGIVGVVRSVEDALEVLNAN